MTKIKKMNSKLKTQSSSLIWVYPPNDWQSSSSKTFVYGYSNPRARLFVQCDEYLTPERINVFPSGNFAKVISLPNVENTVRLIQITNKKTSIIKRNIYIKPVGATFTVVRNKRAGTRPAPTKKYYHSREMVIVIDPGHGGKEHGTHSPKGIPEKHFNLQIAKMLVEMLRTTSLQWKIYLTRTNDKFVSLNERVNFAKKKKCNIFISIHHNALPDGEDPLKHMGVGIYYSNDYVKLLAKKLLFTISNESRLRRYGIFRRDFFVTRPRFYKGVLIECGFLTHPIEAEYLIQRETQERIVKGIVKALTTLNKTAQVLQDPYSCH